MGDTNNGGFVLRATVNAVVLAGGRNSEAMRAATGVENRALVRLGTRTMLEHVVAALSDSETVGEIVVVGDVPPGAGYRVIAPGATLVDTLFAGLTALGSERPALAVTSDIPFLTPAAVNDFVLRAEELGADFCYPIIPLAACQARFSEMRRTSLKLREGQFTGGNLMRLNPASLQHHRETILQAFAARKSPFALGRMLGIGLTLRLLLSQTTLPQLLTIAQLETGVSRLLGCRAAALITDYAEIGADVDKPDDLTVAQALLSGS